MSVQTTPRAPKPKGKGATTITTVTTLAQDEVEETDDGNEDPDEDPAPGEKPDAAIAAAAATASASAAEIVSYCVANGAPLMAAGFITSGATMDAVKLKVGAATDIRKRVADAHGVNPDKIKADLADEMISVGLTPDQAGAKLLELLAAGQSAEIRSQTAPTGAGSGINADVTSWAETYAKLDANGAVKRPNSDADGWGAAFAKLNPPSNARR